MPSGLSDLDGIFVLELSNRLLCFVELVLALLAAGAAPVVGEVIEGNAVVLGGIVDIAAD